MNTSRTTGFFWNKEQVYSQDEERRRQDGPERHKRKRKANNPTGLSRALQTSCTAKRKRRKQRCPSKVKRNGNIDQRHFKKETTEEEKKRVVKRKIFNLLHFSLGSPGDLAAKGERRAQRMNRGTVTCVFIPFWRRPKTDKYR